MAELIIGGARSGKSRHAEALLASAACDVVYIATAEAKDGEMAERIARHRQARDPAWTTVEAPLELAPALLERDVDAFGEALYELQRTVGECFAAAQGGVWPVWAQGSRET